MRAGLGRLLVLCSVFVCAACGLLYELELVALASYLAGDTVTHASVVLSVMVFAMGVGSLLAKRLRCRASVGFGCVEAMLALVGGGSAMAMYAWFAWIGPSRWALVGFSLIIGVLIGAEMPLLMTLIQRIRAQDPGGAVADLCAADYVGALVGGLAFPFLLRPFCGPLTGALLTGVVNTVAGGAVVLWLFRRDLSRRAWRRLFLANALVLLLLAACGGFVDHFERAARHAVYGGDVRVAVHTGVQEVVLTGGVGGCAEGGGGGGPGTREAGGAAGTREAGGAAGTREAGGGGGGDANAAGARDGVGDAGDSGAGTSGVGRGGAGEGRADAGGANPGGADAGGADAGGADAGGGDAGGGDAGGAGAGGGDGGRSCEAERPLELFLDGRLQVSGADAGLHHESLVHPAMAGSPHRRVLILGGGDGLVLRQVLRHTGARSVTVVDLDPEVVRLARTDPGLSALNRDAFADPRVRVTTADAFEWLRKWPQRREAPYDVVICDLPDPGISSSTKLYSQEFFGLAGRALTENGRLAVDAGEAPADVQDQSYWTVDATLRSLGLHTSPYLVDRRVTDPAARAGQGARQAGGGDAGGDGGDGKGSHMDGGEQHWGFVLARYGDAPPPLRLAADGPEPRSLTPQALREAAQRAERGRMTGLPPSTLMRPRYQG